VINDWLLLKTELSARLPERSLRGWLATFPASIVLISFITAVGLVTADDTPAEFAEKLEKYGMSYEILKAGHFWHLLTGTFIQSEPGIAWSMILLLVCSLVPCEYLAGSRRMLITFFISDWVATLLMVLSLRLLAGLGMASAQASLNVPDAGSSAAAHGCMAAAFMLLPRRLAFASYGIFLAVTVALLFQQELDAGIAHMAAVLVGGALGWFAWRPGVEAENEAKASLQSETAQGAILPLRRN
jgi:hypothetical protein